MCEEPFNSTTDMLLFEAVKEQERKEHRVRWNSLMKQKREMEEQEPMR